MTETNNLNSGKIPSTDQADGGVPVAGSEDAPCVTDPVPLQDTEEQLRMLEALLFAAAEPLDRDSLAARLPEGADVGALIEDLQKMYEGRGVNLVCLANKWLFHTAEDLSFLMERETVKQKRLSNAALETLAIVAYHQPVTRAEIEEIRGVSVSKGTLDVLLETGWVRLRGRRRTPGRPVTYGTSEAFLVHFGLETIEDLPGLEELRTAGLLDGHLPPNFIVPRPVNASPEEEEIPEDEEEIPEDEEYDNMPDGENEKPGNDEMPRNGIRLDNDVKTIKI